MGTNLNVRSYGDILNFLFFPKTPLLVICGLLFAASCYIASRGLESIGRTGWVIVPYVLVVYLVLVILVWKNIEWRNLTPLLGPGLDHLALSGVRYSSIFSEVIVLTIFFPHVRSKKEYQSGIWLGWGIVVVMMVIFLALFVFVFDFNSTRKEAFPFQHLTRFADFGPYIQHVEALFLGFWVMAGVVHFAIYIFATSAILGHTLKIDKWEPLILPITGLALLVGMLPENMTTTVFLSREMLLTGASCFFIILPFLLWTVDRFRGRIRL
jgi:spore germination protein KB